MANEIEDMFTTGPPGIRRGPRRPRRAVVLGALVLAGIAACSRPADQAVPDHDWPVYLGDHSVSQYSPLAQIDTENVYRLTVAWTYRTGDVWDPSFAQIQANPLIVDGVLYGTSPEVDVFALDAATGAEIWRFDPSQLDGGELDMPSRFMGVNRGVALWSDGADQRVFFARGARLFALDSRTGQPIPGFGDGGAVDLRAGLGRDVSHLYVGATTPGIVFEDLLIQGTRVGEGPDSAPGHIRAYDVRTGAIAWTFHTIPQPGEYGYETWPADAWQYAGGANNWAGMALDEARGIVYAPTGSATFDFWGGNRHGQNLFANTLLALDARTGERLWHFQAVHHDILDRDLPAPPALLTVEHGGRRVDAVAQVTKTGHVFLFDRATGEPLFPIEERGMPASVLRGEAAWPSQPFPLRPEPFARQTMTEADISDLDPEARPELLRQFRQLTSGGPYVPLDTTGTLVFPGFDGGGEWGGAAVDPDGVMYVNANDVPWIGLLFDTAATPAGDASLSRGEAVYRTYCANCHGSDLGGVEHQSSPPLTGLAERSTPELVRQQTRQGVGFMPSFLFLPDRDLDALVAFMFGLPEADEAADAEETPPEPGPTAAPYAFMGYNRFVDANGYPAVKPPWGTLSAIDLNTGTYRWRIPLGEFPELTARGVPPTGTENYGGPVVTGGGLVFIAATRDGMFRAFDQRSGELLWETRLPAAGFATPSTYSVDGRQFVVIAAGGGKLGQPSGDAYIAFALPRED